MFYLVSTLNCADADAFIKSVGALPQEFLDEWGIAENNVYRSVDENVAIIVNGYKTLEAAQKHQAELDKPELRAQHKEQLGVDSYDLLLVDRRVAR